MCQHHHPASKAPKIIDTESPFTRRAFLGGSLALASAAMSVPGFIGQSASALPDAGPLLSSMAGVPEDRVMVVIQLSGGNDGLNSLIPYGQDAYYQARPNLGIKQNDALKLSGADGLGVHQALRPIWELMEAGTCGMVQGVGYPNPNRSHFLSTDIWHAATDNQHGKNRGRGWIGLALDQAKQNGQLKNATMAGIAAGNDPLAMRGHEVRPIGFDRPELFRYLGDRVKKDVEDHYDQAINAASGRAVEDPALAFVQQTALDARAASSKVRKAMQQKNEAQYGKSSLAQQLAMIAKMIKAGLPTRVYYAYHGGFDTHSNQLNRQTQRLSEFATAVGGFQKELKQSGHSQRVVTMAFSEFGRRVKENASAGTDHGTAGHMFVFGDNVKTKLTGKMPSLTELADGDLVHTTDFRSVYAELLDDWMKIDSKAVLGQDYGKVGILS